MDGGGYGKLSRGKEEGMGKTNIDQAKRFLKAIPEFTYYTCYTYGQFLQSFFFLKKNPLCY